MPNSKEPPRESAQIADVDCADLQNILKNWFQCEILERVYDEDEDKDPREPRWDIQCMNGSALKRFIEMPRLYRGTQRPVHNVLRYLHDEFGYVAVESKHDGGTNGTKHGTVWTKNIVVEVTSLDESFSNLWVTWLMGYYYAVPTARLRTVCRLKHDAYRPERIGNGNVLGMVFPFEDFEELCRPVALAWTDFKLVPKVGGGWRFVQKGRLLVPVEGGVALPAQPPV